jgi:hypothetical protein
MAEKSGLFGQGGGIGASTFSGFGGAVSDLFAAGSLKTKAKGSRLQAQAYDLASELALRNKQFTETSTQIKQAQIDRDVYKSLGETRGDVAAAGFEASGSALDILRDSASQGALTNAVAGQQGLIEEAGYEEQAKSYQLMKSAALMSAKADEKAATGAYISAGIKAIAGFASLA